MEEADNVCSEEEILMCLNLCGRILHHKMADKFCRSRILFILSQRSEILQRELQNILEVQSGSLSEIIIKMEAEGYIQKEKSSRDGRNVILKITPEGIVRAQEYKAEYKGLAAKMFSCFSSEEINRFDFLLDKLLNYWRANESELGVYVPPKRKCPKLKQTSG